MKKMLFKFGLTVIVLVAVYIYFAKDSENNSTSEWWYENAPSDATVRKELSQVAGNVGKRNNVKDPIASATRSSSHLSEGLHLAIVTCGDRLEETLVLLKSAVLFSNTFLIFHIFAEYNLHIPLKEQLEFWPPKYGQQVDYHIYNISFPNTQSATSSDWKKLFKPCAAQRLFIPSLLPDVEALLYVDTDILFLSPVEHIWSLFNQFNTSHLAALAPEHEDRATGWYNRFARHPYYGELGVNSGVMLMNLTRLRNSSWQEDIRNYHLEYKLKITFGDQDIINIYFHYHPEELFVFSCAWNYRPDHCMYMSVCKPAEETGVYILHGSRRTWHQEKQPAFKAVYTAFKKHRLGSSVQFDMLESLQHNLHSANGSNCGNLHQRSDLFTKQIQTYVRQMSSSQQNS